MSSCVWVIKKGGHALRRWALASLRSIAEVGNAKAGRRKGVLLDGVWPVEAFQWCGSSSGKAVGDEATSPNPQPDSWPRKTPG